MKEITCAIKTRQAQIKQLQKELDALQRAARVLGGKKATRGQPKAKPKAERKRKPMSAAARKAVSERMRKYWAGRKK